MLTAIIQHKNRQKRKVARVQKVGIETRVIQRCPATYRVRVLDRNHPEG